MSKYLDPSVAPEHRIVVIGDLHGMVHKARALWKVLEETLTPPVLLSALVVFLGDYCDRGLYTRELLSWLVTVQRERARRGRRTICLIGNHEFCLLAFLGLLPKPQASPPFLFRQTWDSNDSLVSRNERERWWGNDEDGNVLDDVHLQGRRWGGSCYEKSYGSIATFAAYNVERGDREGLRRSMPEEHLDFLKRCPWVHIEESALLGRCVFVHAGLEADGSSDCGEQLTRLKDRDARHPQPEALFGRDGVLHTPPQLARCGTTVVSGHHGRVLLRTHRLVLDSCCGDERNPLAAMILPEMLMVQNDGRLEPRDPALVFPGWSKYRRGPSNSWPPSLFQQRANLPAIPCSSRQSSMPSPTASQDELKETLENMAHKMPQGDFSPLE